MGSRRGRGRLDGLGVLVSRQEGYFAELIRVDDETAAFFRDALHCCDIGGQVVGVGGDGVSSNSIGGLSGGRDELRFTYSMPL